eukprot:gene16322-7711_t
MERKARNSKGVNGHMEFSENDEQMSSDDEESSSSQYGLTHPLALSGSLYSRIHEDVLFRIPSIDLSSAEVDQDEDHLSVDETELVVPPNKEDSNCCLHMVPDVNGTPDLKTIKENGHLKDECAVTTEEDLVTNSVRQLHEINSQMPTCRSQVVELNFKEKDFKTSKNCSEVTNVDSIERNTITDHEQVLNRRRNRVISSNDWSTDNNNELDYESNVLKTILDEKINDENLDKVLVALDSGSNTFQRRETALASGPMMVNERAGKDDTEVPLIDRLSSFALNEKSSIGEANSMLKHLSSNCSNVERNEGKRNIEGIQRSAAAEPAKMTSRGVTTQSRDIEQGTTIFLDLRGSSSAASPKDSQAAADVHGHLNESSSGSDEEDWNQMRRNIKAGIFKTDATKQEGQQDHNREGGNFESVIHDRLSKRTYKRLLDEGRIKENTVSTSRLDSRFSMDDGVTTLPVSKKAGKPTFDLEPLEEKIKSWHQVRDSGGNAVVNAVLRGNDKPGSKIETETSGVEPHDHVDSAFVVATNSANPQDIANAKESSKRGNNKNESVGIGPEMPLLGNSLDGCNKRVTVDTSLLMLEKVGIEADKQEKSLLIVNGDNIAGDKYFESKASVVSIKENPDDKVSSPCCIEELPDKIRITDNLMVIKADISAKCNSTVDEFLPEDLLETPTEYCNEHNAKNAIRIEAEKCCEADASAQAENERSHCVDNENPPSGFTRILSLEQVEKDLISDSKSSKFEKRADFENEVEKVPENCELEMKTFSVEENTSENEVSFCPEDMIELSSTLKGLLPQYIGKMQRTPLRYATSMDAYREKSFEDVTGEETPMITRQDNTTKVVSSDSVRGKSGSVKVELPVKDDIVDKVKGECLTRKSLDPPENISLAEQATNSKGKKKSKKKSKKCNEQGDERYAVENKSLDKDSSLPEKTGYSSKQLKSSKSLDSEQKNGKRQSNGLKESERQLVKEKIKNLQDEFGISNVIFNEDVSFNLPFEPLPSTCKDAAKLLLKVSIETPGVCSKSCAKNSLTFDERSDAFIGLCTLFISLLLGNKFKVAETLGVPFDVISLEQASIDSELQLVVGIIENEVYIQPNQQLKRGKPPKVKKNFYQVVSQFLNKADLEQLLSSLMGFDIAERPYVSNVSCPGTKRLSSYVSVSQDDSAVARIFNLKPSLLWNCVEHNEEPLNDDICWITKQSTRNENTCVLIENVTSMLPKTIATFFKTIRTNSLDVSGLRIAYVKKKDDKEVPFLAAALRGPNVTTVNSGKSFTSNTEELATIKSVFMPSVDSSLTDGPREVNVSLPHGMKSFETSVEDPLITYTIGRGRGEREVVNWFGRRIRQAADVDTKPGQPLQGTKSRHSSLPEKLDLLSRAAASASLLSVVSERVVLTISPLVPTVFISIAMTLGESRGLRALAAGKVLLNEDDFSAMGLKLDNSESKVSRLNFSVMIILFEGESALHRVYGFKQHLFDTLNEKLPRDALTKDALTQRLNGFIRYERIKEERSIDEFFAVKQVNKRTVKILDAMTTPNLSQFGCEVIGRLPAKWNFYLSPEMPRICTVVFVGKPMVETFPQALGELLEDCVDDPLCINKRATTDKMYRQQERPIGEVIGLKYFKGLTRHLAHICSPHVIGAKNWNEVIANLEIGPVVVVVLRLLDTIKYLEEKRDKIYRNTSKLLNSNKLKCPPDSYHNTFIHTGLDTVFRVLLDMFNGEELMPDACHTWYQSTQWPVYLPIHHKFVHEIDSLLGILTNANQQDAFRDSKESTKSMQQNSCEMKIISPTSLSIPAELILGKQCELSFIRFDTDCNYVKYVAKTLGILKRDTFDIVGLNFPAGFSPSYDKVPELHVAVRRPNSVYRLNQWLPELTLELKGKHTMQVSRSAKDAFDSIVRSFQKTENGGIFDESPLAVAERVDTMTDFLLLANLEFS